MTESQTGSVDPWQRTLTEMRGLAEQSAVNTQCIVPAETTPTPPSVGQSDRWGLIYTVPASTATAIRDACDAGFQQDEVYRHQTGGQLYLVTRLEKTEGGELFIAGVVDRKRASALIETADETGQMFTHFQTLDWTQLGSVRHSDPHRFFAALE